MRGVLGIVLAVGLLLVGLAYAAIHYAPEAALFVEESELQERVSLRFPIRDCILSACLEFRDPDVSIPLGSNRISLSLSFAARLGRRHMPGVAELSGVPIYRPKSGSFTLTDVQVARFEMSGNAPDFDEVVRVRGPRVLASIISNVPLYTIRGDTWKEQFVRLSLRSVGVIDGKLRIVWANPLLLFSP